jgi:hypothetical protein
MRLREKIVRATVTGVYFIVCFVGLFYYTYGSFFCLPPRGSGHVAETLRLTVVCTVWAALASTCGAFVAKKSGMRWACASGLGTLSALVGFAYLPFLIYDNGSVSVRRHMGRRDLFH